MALSANNQALLAAFIFGLVLNAASGAAFLFVKAAGRSILRDGPRLVLAIFLISASLWAQVSFSAFLIENEAALPCQVAIAFTSSFDQLARVALEQFLLASINRGQKRSVAWIAVQTVIFLRFVLGCAFVGVQRPQFKPVCTSTTLVLPLGVSALIIDFVLGTVLFAGAIVVGLRKDMKDDDATSARAKGLLLTIAGLLIWTATSVPLLLGIESIDLIPRTVVPATGLLFVIGIVSVFQQSLTGPIDSTTTSQGDNSAYGSSQGPVTGGFPSRNLDTADSYYPPNRYEELKTDAMASGPASTLPAATAPVAGQTFAGMGAFSIMGQQRPQTRDEQRDGLTPMPKDSRKLKSKGGKIVISKPILNSASTQSPLNRIPTVDLATAARNDKERRDLLPHPLASNLIPSRPAPVPGAPSTLQSSNSFKRKDLQRASKSMASNSTSEIIPEMPSRLLTAGLSSSTQLSPGAEDLRRRSPRQSPRESTQISPRMVSKAKAEDVQAQEGSAEALRPFPPPRSPLRQTPAFTFPALAAAATATTLKPESESPADALVPMPELVSANRQRQEVAREDANRRISTRQMEARKTILAGASSVRPNVRPSRQRAPSVPQGSDTSVKTPGERKPSFGLPSNPRARANSVAKSKPLPQEPTVMLFNEVEYSDPATVKRIDDEAAAAVVAQSQPAPAEVVTSVVHRPRPKTRHASTDRPIFPAETSPQHKQYHYRTMSGGSNKSKHSILNATAGDPSQLPPLPPLPQTADEEPRPQPNKTKSMTFDEKMDMFYPAADVQEAPPLPPMPQTLTNRNVSKFSMDSSVMPNGVQGTWVMQTSTITPRETVRKPRSPAEPLPSASAWSEGIRDDATTAWGSVHSPAWAVGLQRAKEVDVPPVPQLADVRLDLIGAKSEPVESMPSEDGSSEVVMVLLDTTVEYHTEPEESVLIGANNPIWHRRVGDDCPTFTQREHGSGSRRVPPPTPLALNRPPKPIYVEAEPSPLESPEEALQAIAMQLKQLENSTDDDAASVEAANRMTLLANLETEMGQQENYWQQIKQNLHRDSLSTVGSTDISSPNRRSRTEVVRISIMSQLEDMSSYEQIRQRLSMTQSQTQSQASWRSRSTSSRSKNSSDRHTRNSTHMNYLTVLQTQAQLGSPTPPDTDESESDSDSEPMTQPFIMVAAATVPSMVGLWKSSQVDQVTKPAEHHLWTLVKKQEVSPKSFSTAPSLPSRTMTKKSFEPLQIETTQLWSASVTRRASFTPATGLWKPLNIGRMEQPKAEAVHCPARSVKPPQARPSTLKPPRRTKRITLLPDILESPKPLPNKRDTLGIFQFPWGEKSDVATIQLRPQTFMAIPGTMSSGTPSARLAAPAPTPEPARILSPQGYSNSFLDEYEQEDDFDGLSDYEEEEEEEEETSGEDDFDESTLWEIASLLQTKNVPSRASLFPGQESDEGDDTSVTDSVDFETFSMENTRNVMRQSALLDAQRLSQISRGSVSIKHDSTVLGDEDYYDVTDEEYQREELAGHLISVFSPGMPSPASTAEDSASEYEDECEAVVKLAEEQVVIASVGVWSPPTTAAQPNFGLPQPADWSRQLAVVGQGLIRAKLRKALPATITSTRLWSATEGKVATSAGVWSPPMVAAPRTYGLRQPKSENWQHLLAAVAQDPVRTKLRKAVPAAITSRQLWAPSSADKAVPSTGLWPVRSLKAHSVTLTRQPVSIVSVGVWSPPVSVAPKTQGLPQAEGWNSLLISNTEPVRAKLRNAVPATITTTQLWAPPKPEAIVSSRVWTIVPKKTQSTASAGVWSLPVTTTSKSLGLPQSEEWNSLSGDSSPVRAKLRNAVPAAISTSDLWAPSKSKATNTSWIRSVAPKKVQSTASAEVWSAPVATAPQTFGLPQPEGQDWQHLTTFAQEPVRAKLRRGASSPIASSQLWASSAQSMEISSEPLWGDSKQSVDAIELPTPVLSEVAIEITPAKVPEPIKVVAPEISTEAPAPSPARKNVFAKIGSWSPWSRKRSNSTMSTTSTPATPPPVQAPEGVARKDSGKIMPWRGATAQEWDAALQVAVRAGRRRQLPAASEANWTMAMEDAIAAGNKTAIAAPVSKLASLWAQPNPALPSSTPALWQPTDAPAAEDSLAELPAAHSFKLSRPMRSEKVRSLHSTSFEFSSQALWNPARAAAEGAQKDWLREESAFGWYQG
jgi:hypothetical protein